MQTREQAKNEIMEFKKDLQYYSDLYGNDQDWSWNDGDEKMFNFLWTYIESNKDSQFKKVVNCSFADCAHFYFDFAKGILDFTVDDPEQTDIWQCPNFFSHDTF